MVFSPMAKYDYLGCQEGEAVGRVKPSRRYLGLNGEEGTRDNRRVIGWHHSSYPGTGDNPKAH